MPKHYQSTAVALLPVVLTACSTMSHRQCPSGQEPAIQHVLYFGAEKPSGRVTHEEWEQFLGEVVTPRFPQGLTAWRASGQWRSGAGNIVQEPSYVLALVHPVSQVHESAIREISAAYKLQFQQEAVLQVRANVCTAM